MAKNGDLSILTDTFGLLSDKTRLQIVLLLSEGETNVTTICEQIKLPQPTISHHLGLLRMNRLIVNKRNGKQVLYSLAPNVKASSGKIKVSLPPHTVTVEY